MTEEKQCCENCKYKIQLVSNGLYVCELRVGPYMHRGTHPTRMHFVLMVIAASSGKQQRRDKYEV